MKIKFYASYAFLVGMLMLFGMYSCQTEPLDSEQNLSTTSSSSSKTDPVILDWSCNTAATEVDLLAGQTILVGKVNVEVVGSDYKITYTITDDAYCLTSTHLSVATSPDLFPNNNGNPTNGQFEYGDDVLDCVSTVTYTVPTSKGAYIAAHAVVNCKENAGEGFFASLPETVDFCLRTGREIENARAYFEATIAEGPLAGTYWAWCADVNKSIDASGEDKCYQNFNVYSLNDDLSGIISLPENIDNALWLLNNTDALLDNGYLYGNIQWAFWKLLRNQECNSCNANLKLPSGEDAKIKGMEIYNMAIANGEGYSPACEEKTMVIFDDGVHQPVIIPVPTTCDETDCEETAWGDGCAFPGKTWGTYFKYDAGS